MLLQQVSRWWPGSGTPPETARAESRRASASARRLPPISAKCTSPHPAQALIFLFIFFRRLLCIAQVDDDAEHRRCDHAVAFDQVAWLIKIIATYGYGYGYESEVSLSYLPIRIPSTAKPEPRTVGEHDRKYAQLFVGHGAGRYKLQTPRTEPNQQTNLPLRNKTT